MSSSLVIDVRAEEPDFSPLKGRRPRVEKIIVGESPTDSNATTISVDSLPLLKTDFPALTHLFLWSTTDLVRLPALSPRQQVLEVRLSADLETIDWLPLTLQSLVLEDCPKLQNLPSLDGYFEALTELSLAGCASIDPEWIESLIAKAPRLKHLDLSRCSQLEQLPAELPAGLDRLELNGCGALRYRTDPLPVSLRRLGLRNAESLKELPPLPAALDYLDLAFTRSLLRLPSFPKTIEDDRAGKPRTLFLYGSGVLQPPASEHGSTAHTNVAAETREYQDEVELVGSGDVRRCKLLLLGNGSAGKTKLALNLIPGLSSAKKEDGGDYPGSTHGVQFWDWPNFDAVDATTNRKLRVHLHLWDFGGQEIYHSTHRLFVSRGSVFVIVWNPDQDGRQPDAEGGFQDVWYPIRYWLDYIRTESPHHNPLIAIVCSHQGKDWSPDDDKANHRLKEKLRAKLQRDTGKLPDDIPLFVLDSETDTGEREEREELEEWIRDAVHTVIETQGTVVPTYWEIAQNMVERWLPDARTAHQRSSGQLQAERARLSLDQFADEFRHAISEQWKEKDKFTRYDSLRQHWNDGGFLTERRLQRTLRFLTHSGWLYWNAELFQSRVIVDQAWALEAVYTALQRDSDSSIYDNFIAAQGRFTFQQLQDWCWSGGPLDESDQRLILSFMESVGACFRLGHSYHWETDQYISPVHLPDAGSMPEEFQLSDVDQSDEVRSAKLHRGHWFQIMGKLCKRYGDDGTYAKDACRIDGSSYRWNRGDDRWSAVLRFQLDDPQAGLGGKIQIDVAGKSVGERFGSLKQFVESQLPDFEGNPEEVEHAYDHQHHCLAEGAKTVFFSYAWDPVDKEGYYEEAVDAIYDALKRDEMDGRVRLLRDKVSMEPGDYISEYVANAGSQNVDLVLVFTSDRYWRSWWCMLELHSLIKSMIRTSKNVGQSALSIEHETGKKRFTKDIQEYVDHWEQLKLDGDDAAEIPEQLLDLNLSEFRKRFVTLISDSSRGLTSDAVGSSREWKPENAAEIIAWIREKLGLKTP